MTYTDFTPDWVQHNVHTIRIHDTTTRHDVHVMTLQFSSLFTRFLQIPPDSPRFFPESSRSSRETPTLENYHPEDSGRSGSRGKPVSSKNRAVSIENHQETIRRPLENHEITMDH